MGEAGGGVERKLLQVGSKSDEAGSGRRGVAGQGMEKLPSAVRVDAEVLSLGEAE